MSSREEIKRQIEALQAKLGQQPPTPKRRKDDSKVLAPATPSPRKKQKTRYERDLSPSRQTGNGRAQVQQGYPLLGSSKSNTGHASTPSSSHYVASNPPGPSTLFSQLKSISVNTKNESESITRSEGFSDKPAAKASGSTAPARDDNLAIVEELEVGPTEHNPPADDPTFERLEPNSGIRLKSRVLSHDALQDHLSGRYFLPPSLLYSVVRLLPDKKAYEVPVEGDWVTIAVVAERGEVRHTKGPGNAALQKHGDEGEIDGDKQGGKKSGRSSGKGDDVDDDENPRTGGKKYVQLRLIDLGTRSRSTSSSNSRNSLRGDAQLSLMLFESDYSDKLISSENGKRREQKIWRGGSGGAFEECFTKLREGAVVALLNPKVLKPFQNSKNPSNASILGLTPPSASAIAIIGYALDLGMCTVVKRDGKPCRAWVDRRIGTAGSKKPGEDVCEYHIEHTVQRVRANRPEFSMGTSGMSTTSAKGKSTCDARRQWGLKPEGPARGTDGEAMYVIGGHVASTSRDQAPGFAAESIGREGQAKARRRCAQREDEALKALLSRADRKGHDEDGGVPISRDALEVLKRAKEAMKMKEENRKKAEKKRSCAKDDDDDDVASEAEVEDFVPPFGSGAKKAYSAEMIKRIGFNPLLNAYGMQLNGAGNRKGKGKKDTSKLGTISADKREIRLGPPPGLKVRSGVRAPISSAPASGTAEATDDTQGKGSGTARNCMSAASAVSRLSGDPNSKNVDSDSDLEIEPPARLCEVAE